jgi:hypothetical protein
MQGKGTYTWENGDRYEGDFIKNNRTGKGKFVWKDGSYYIGEWKEGNRHGFGKMTLPQNSSYISSYGSNGKWVGKTYIAEGLWDKNNFLFTCANKRSCLTQQKVKNDKTVQAQKQKQATKQMPGTLLCTVVNPENPFGGGKPIQVFGRVEAASGNKVKLKITGTNPAGLLWSLEIEGQRADPGYEIWTTSSLWDVCE